MTDTPPSSSYDIRLQIPFAGAVHPSISRTAPSHLTWMRDTRLLPDTTAVDRYVHWRSPELAARWFPHAVGDGLRLGMDLFGWLLVLDDSFDSLDTTPACAQQRIDRLEELLDHSPGSGGHLTDPIEAAFADLWAREQQHMSCTWRERARTNWKDYLRCYIAETANRYGGVTLTPEAYLRLRDKSGIMYPVLDSAERIGGFELPDTVTSTAAFRHMRDACVWVCNIVQDLLSFEREEANGDPHNLVFVLELHRHCTRQQAIDQIRTMIDEQIQRFTRARDEFAGVCDDLGVLPLSQQHAQQFIDHMQAAMRATYDWCLSSPRYQSQTGSGAKSSRLEAGP